MPADASPDSKCPICLDKFDNIAYLGYCWHRFCFRCIREWSKTKAECPLCKQPFFSIFHTIRAEDDFQEYTVTPSGEAALSSPEGSTTSSAESPFNVRIYDLHDNYDYLTPSDDEGSGSDSAVTAETPGSEYSSSVSDVSQASWDDETPGPIFFTLEDYGATSASLWEFLESPDDDSAWETTMLQPQLQAGGDSSDSDTSSEYYHSTTCLNFYTEGTAELTELSSDSEESIREEKREDAKKEQSLQGHSWSDSELSSSSSPCCSLYKENVSSCQSSLQSVVKKTVSMDKQKSKDYIKNPSPSDSAWSLSPGMDNTCPSCSQRQSQETKSPKAYPQNCDDNRGHQPWRKRRSKHQLKKRRSGSRDASKHRSKRSRWSRPRDSSPSLKSQRGSSSRESTTSTDSSRSRSRHEGRGQRRSRSTDSDRHYRSCCYPSYSQKTPRDGSSCRNSTHSKAHCSRKSPDPEFRTQPFTGRQELHSQTGLHEKQDCCYEQGRSSSQSSSRSRTPSAETDRTRSEKPGGKRKCKTRHLENAEQGSTSMEGENSLKRPASTFSECYENESSLSDDQPSSETEPKRKKKRMRSPSLERDCEGREAGPEMLSKKNKKHRKHHQKFA